MKYLKKYNESKSDIYDVMKNGKEHKSSLIKPIDSNDYFKLTRKSIKCDHRTYNLLNKIKVIPLYKNKSYTLRWEEEIEQTGESTIEIIFTQYNDVKFGGFSPLGITLKVLEDNYYLIYIVRSGNYFTQFPNTFYKIDDLEGLEEFIDVLNNILPK